MIALLFLACGGAPDRGCLHGELGDWCFHDENAEGPVLPDGGGTCETPTFTPGPGTFRCGDLDVDEGTAGPSFTGVVKYFDHASGAFVAAKYWTDYNHYCGDFVYWYGERELDCEADCTYDPDDTTLPACE